jgi:hypothetical protein
MGGLIQEAMAAEKTSYYEQQEQTLETKSLHKAEKATLSGTKQNASEFSESFYWQKLHPEFFIKSVFRLKFLYK